MSKRFTDTEKWRDEWFLELSKENKIIWIYLVDNCTNAGRWKKSFKHLNFCCESKIANKDLLEIFDGRVIDKESYVFIPKFLTFQYPNGLNSEKKALVAVVKELALYGLIETVVKLFGSGFLSIPNQSLINHRLIQETEKEKETEKDKDTEKEKGIVKGEELGSEFLKQMHEDVRKIKSL